MGHEVDVRIVEEVCRPNVICMCMTVDHMCDRQVCDRLNAFENVLSDCGWSVNENYTIASNQEEALIEAVCQQIRSGTKLLDTKA